ncbi:DNA/RNA helicase domain-containing protein [Chryseobacterium arachidis]|uniref:DNA/RNA helicase domain-containing protein n=1 Tax=Chryseobacterium arachidis TaxID=1416778 RepID=UPI00361E16C7
MLKKKISAADWFLNDENDIRSSYYLEDVATEFDIQGLEIDYTCLAWDINMYYDNEWKFKHFIGSKWTEMNESRQNYLLNSYRVLLTRARQGMVIFIPEVDNSDWTRPKDLYDSTFEYFKSCGFDILQ